MGYSSAYYALLADLLRQMALSPQFPPVILVARAGDEQPEEQQLLDELQATSTALQARALEQATLLEVSRTLASALALEPTLILDQMRILVDYTHGALFVLDERRLVLRAARGAVEQADDAPAAAWPPVIALADPQTHANLRHPRRIADLHGDDTPARFAHALLGGSAAALPDDLRAWLWVPLVVDERMVGGIALAHGDVDHFSVHDEALALTVANQAAITLVNANLYAQAQTLATRQERQRLAQNLHDAVNQSLFSASLIADVLPRLWARDPAAGRRSLQDLRRLTRGAMAEMRSLLATLQPLVLIDSELGDLLQQLADSLIGRNNINVTVATDGSGSIPAEVQVTVYRLCQEALNNVAKHANAQNVKIDLRYDAKSLVLTIDDDGRGFDPAVALAAGHYGLRIMHERAAAIGAALTLESTPGAGSHVHVVWAQAPEPRL